MISLTVGGPNGCIFYTCILINIMNSTPNAKVDHSIFVRSNFYFVCILFQFILRKKIRNPTPHLDRVGIHGEMSTLRDKRQLHTLLLQLP